MDAKQARERSTAGAIDAIERLIEKNADNGLRSVDLTDYYMGDVMSDTVREHFEENGYEIEYNVIKW